LAAGDVGAQPAFGLLRVTLAQGALDLGVVAPDPSEVLQVTAVAMVPEELVALIGTGHDLDREPVAGRLQDQQVEGQVVLQEGHERLVLKKRPLFPAQRHDDGVHVVTQAAQLLARLLGQQPHRLPDGVTLDHHAHLIRVQQVAAVEPGHEGAGRRDLVEHPLLSQAADRLAHGRAAGAALGREGLLGELLPRDQFAGHQLLRDMRVNVVS